MKKKTVVLYAGMGVGHLTPMVALAKLFLRQTLAVTIVTVDPPPTFSSSTSAAISRLASSNPSISFHILPAVAIPSESIHSPFNQIYVLHGGVRIDSNREIGHYLFFPSGASVLASNLHIPVLDKTLSTSFKDTGRMLIEFPGLPPVPAADLPQTLQDRRSESYKTRVKNYPGFIEVDGILINTFEELESRAVEALRSGRWSEKMPPIYCIGPLITQATDNGSETKHECLTWLDAQPKQSVVFLCFGSMGAFSAEQIKEIAIGLENSGQRFLWVIKVQDGSGKILDPQPDLYSVLPDGFIDRTKDRGMVVKSWAPQAQVLQHESVGGFVSHCGWNSTLEAVTYGVPMVCWPLYAEQRLNKVILVEEIGIGVVMDGYDEGLVQAEEVEKKVRWLMESDGGKALKERMAEVKLKANEALEDGGSSSQAFVQLLRDFEGMNKGN